MTAIALCYTKSGFVIAADGQSSSYDAAKDEYTPKDSHCTKIFGMLASGRSLGYSAMSNFVFSEDGSFSLFDEIERQRKSSTRFETLRDYIRAVGYKATKAYRKAWKSGRFDPWPEADPENTLIARIIFAGYVLQKPSWMQVEIIHQNGYAEMCQPSQVAPLTYGRCALAGPEKVVNSVLNGSEFASYRNPFGPDLSLEEGGELAVNLIKACMTPLALELDPLCKNLGGDIHVAAITPVEFKWLVEPKGLRLNG